MNRTEEEKMKGKLHFLCLQSDYVDKKKEKKERKEGERDGRSK